MVPRQGKETLKCHAIMQVFTGVQLKAEVDSRRVKSIKNR